ncbi:MAG: hypothetical protein HQK65_10015 [Desulfamplus sp.]|nr:hypothetical protein [Desulfamplus sp.]
MTNEDKIYNSLKVNGSMCDDCLVCMTKVTPRQSVNTICRKRQELDDLKRTKSLCPLCKKNKLINQLNDSWINDQIHVSNNENDINSQGIKFRSSQSPLNIRKFIDDFIKAIQNKEIEVYNEFSLQHELGFFLRSFLPNKRVQFERNISFLRLDKAEFEKREIDIVIYDKNIFTKDAVIELKYPRNGKYPEAMYDICKDIAFTEQLKNSGFGEAFAVVLADDKNFYEGKQKGIYGYFRSNTEGSEKIKKQKKLNGKIDKPTGENNESVNIKGTYSLEWKNIDNKLKSIIIEIN